MLIQRKWECCILSCSLHQIRRDDMAQGFSIFPVLYLQPTPYSEPKTQQKEIVPHVVTLEAGESSQASDISDSNAHQFPYVVTELFQAGNWPGWNTHLSPPSLSHSPPHFYRKGFDSYCCVPKFLGMLCSSIKKKLLLWCKPFLPKHPILLRRMISLLICTEQS